MSTSSPRLVPYAGLRPFRTDEDYLFFGREDQTAELLRLLREQRFLAVVGRSGSGKSSLVRAGLLPEIQGGMMQSTGSAWDIAVLRPGGHPLRNLAESLLEADLYDADDEEAVPRLLATLNHSALGLVESFRQSDIEAGANLLLVVDQFEELFRFEQHDARAQDEAHAFVELLLEASRSREVSIYVVLTMRSDYLGDCAHVPGLAEAVNLGEYLIPRLDRSQLRSAIEGPAKVGGAVISYRLVQHLLNELGDEEDQLPILQHALMRTWTFWEKDHQAGEEIDLRHYEGTGGMQLAISNHADEIFEALPDDRHRRVAESLFRSLTVKGEDNRGVRRPLMLSTLAAIAGEDLDTLRSTIEAYRRQGVTFLMPGEDTALAGDTVIDLSHESLMRVWQRLRRWVDDEAQSARIYRRLRDTSQLWKRKQAGLYHDPDLGIAQTWREEHQPNAAWAALYGGDFTDASEFLDQSQEEAERVERKREEARQRELAQAKALADSQARTAGLLKRFAVTVGAAAIVAIGLAVWAMQESTEAKAQKARAEAQTELALAAETKAKHAQGRTWLANAQTLLRAKDFFGARVKAMRAVGFEGYGRGNLTPEQQESFPPLLQEDLPGREEVASIVHANAESTLLWQCGSLAQSPGQINSLAVSPDGRFAASAPEGEVDQRDEHYVQIWDLASGELVTTVESTVPDNEVVAFSPEGRYLVLGGDNELAFWEIKGRQFIPKATFRSEPKVTETIGEDGAAEGRNEEDESAEQNSPAPRADFRSIAFSPDGETLALGDHHGHLYVWNNWRSFQGFPDEPIREDLYPKEIDGKNSDNRRIVDLEFQPGSGAILATVCQTADFVTLLDGQTFETIKTLPPPATSSRQGNPTVLRDLSFSADGSLLAVGGDYMPITIWKMADRNDITATTLLQEEWEALNVESLPETELTELTKLGFAGSSLSFSHEGFQLAVGWRQLGKTEEPRWYRPTITLFDLEDGTDAPARIEDFPVEADFARDTLFTPDDQRLLLGLNNHSRLQLWDRATKTYVGGDPGAHLSVIEGLRFSPDGTLIASSDRLGTIRIWDAHTGTPRHAVRAHLGRAPEICFSADGRRLFSIGHEDKTLKAWDTRTGALLGTDEVEIRALVSVTLTPDGESVVVGGWSEDYRFYNPQTLELQTTVKGSSGNRMLFSPDGKQVAIARNNENGRPAIVLHHWGADRTLGARTLDLPAPMHGAGLKNIVFSPDGLTFAVGFGDGLVRTWDRQSDGTWDEATQLTMPDGAGEAWVQFTPSGERLITADDSGNACVWNRAGGLLQTLPGPDTLTSLAVSPDGRILVTGSQQGILQMWSMDNESGIRARIGGIGIQNSGNFWSNGSGMLGLAPKRGLVFSASHGSGPHPNAVQAWHLRGGRLTPAFILEGPTAPPPFISVSPDERYLAASGATRDGDGSVVLWDLETRTHRVILEAPVMATVFFSPDSRTLATRLTRSAASDDPIQFWDPATGEGPLAETVPFREGIPGRDFTPDGTQLVVAEFLHGAPIRFLQFDPETRATTLLPKAVPGNSDRFTRFSISPDGSFLMAASTAGAHTKLWDLPDLTPRGPHPRIDLDDWTFSSAISPDGSLVAVGGGNSKVVVARTDGSGEQVAAFEGPSAGWLKFTADLKFADNRTLLASFNDGTIITYRLPAQIATVKPERYLEVLDLEEASGELTWSVRSTRLTPATTPIRFARLEDSHLPFLETTSSELEAQLALFDYYLDGRWFQVAYSIALALPPEEAAPLWPRFASAIADALVSFKLDGNSAAAGPIRQLALRVFEQYPPSLDVQLLLLIENSDWERIGTFLQEKLPTYPPEEARQHLKTFFAALDDYLQSLLERSEALGKDDPSIPSRDLLLAAALFATATSYRDAWDLDPWQAETTFNTLAPATQLLERLEQDDQTVLMPSGTKWNYFRDPGAPDPGWTEVAYDDRTWPGATAPLGYSKPSENLITYGDGEMLDVPRTKESGQLTYYFRTEFETPAGWDAALRQLTASFRCDDGLMLYLDGEEILRHNMNAGNVTAETTASRTINAEKTEWLRAPTAPVALTPGRHLLAAEIHQSNKNSSDILLELSLLAPSADTWRAPESLQTATRLLSRLDPDHRILPWLASFQGARSAESPEAGFQAALHARILAELGALEQALEIGDQRLAELESSHDPVLIGERKRWLRWKADVLASLGRPEAEHRAALDAHLAIPPRPPGLDPRLIDLTNYYTRSFYWSGFREVAIPETFVPLKGIAYDVRGVIELNSAPVDDQGNTVRDKRDWPVPDKVEGIEIGQKTPAIHVLLNAFWGRETEAVEVGKLILHYDDGSTAERPIVFIEDVVDWWAGDGKETLSPDKIGWRNPRPSPPTSLAELTWTNPHPDKTIVTMDFVSSLRKAGPFLVAITLE